MGLIQDSIRLLLALAPAAALVTLVLAGLALRREGTTAFSAGGGFSRWMFWAIVWLTLPQLLSWFSFFGLLVPVPGGAITTPWLVALRNDVSTFVTAFVVDRLAPILAAWLVLRSTLDAAEGRGLLPSILGAMFLLAIPATAALLEGWNSGNRFATADVLSNLWTYTASRIMPVAAGLAVIGAILNFAAGKPSLRLVGCAVAFLCVSALWRLVMAMM